MKQDKLMELLKAELNSIPSKDISIEECNKISMQLWTSSNRDYDLCMETLKTLKSQNKKVISLKNNAEAFLKRLSGAINFSEEEKVISKSSSNSESYDFYTNYDLDEKYFQSPKELGLSKIKEHINDIELCATRIEWIIKHYNKILLAIDKVKEIEKNFYKEEKLRFDRMKELEGNFFSSFFNKNENEINAIKTLNREAFDKRTKDIRKVTVDLNLKPPGDEHHVFGKYGLEDLLVWEMDSRLVLPGTDEYKLVGDYEEWEKINLISEDIAKKYLHDVVLAKCYKQLTSLNRELINRNKN